MCIRNIDDNSEVIISLPRGDTMVEEDGFDDTHTSIDVNLSGGIETHSKVYTGSKTPTQLSSHAGTPQNRRF